MKKRRSNPIPLLSVMLLCFVLIGYFNSKANPDDKSAQQQQQQPPSNVETNSALGKPSAAPSKEVLKGQVNIGNVPPTGPNMSPAKAAAMMQPGGPGAHGGPPGGPGGPPPGMRPSKPYKPKPSDSAIGVQWWTPEANKSFDH